MQQLNGGDTLSSSCDSSLQDDILSANIPPPPLRTNDDVAYAGATDDSAAFTRAAVGGSTRWPQLCRCPGLYISLPTRPE